MPAERFGVVSPTQGDGEVALSNGAALPIRAHCGYTDSRDAAQEAATRIGGVFVEREGPTWAQRGAYALLLGRCRGCDEGACGIPSHGRD